MPEPYIADPYQSEGTEKRQAEDELFSYERVESSSRTLQSNTLTTTNEPRGHAPVPIGQPYLSMSTASPEIRAIKGQQRRVATTSSLHRHSNERPTKSKQIQPPPKRLTKQNSASNIKQQP